MKRTSSTFQLLTFLAAICALLGACGNSSLPFAPLPAGNVADILNVRVSTPNETEIDELPTISQLPVSTCTRTAEKTTCTISADQPIKWGWGFCDNDAAALRVAVPNAQVILLVDNVRIPGDLIYQRDEVYDRQEHRYCHTWFIKLDNWVGGSSVRLQNRAQAGDVLPQVNTFVVDVE